MNERIHRGLLQPTTYIYDRDTGDEHIACTEHIPNYGDVCHCGQGLADHRWAEHAFTPMEEPPPDFDHAYERATTEEVWL